MFVQIFLYGVSIVLIIIFIIAVAALMTEKRLLDYKLLHNWLVAQLAEKEQLFRATLDQKNVTIGTLRDSVIKLEGKLEKIGKSTVYILYKKDPTQCAVLGVYPSMEFCLEAMSKALDTATSRLANRNQTITIIDRGISHVIYKLENGQKIELCIFEGQFQL